MDENLADPQMRKCSQGMNALKEIEKKNTDGFVCGKL